MYKSLSGMLIIYRQLSVLLAFLLIIEQNASVPAKPSRMLRERPMSRLPVFIFLLINFLTLSASWASACVPAHKGLEVKRHVQIDASSGPIFGRIVRFAAEPSFLRPKEVVLTFDDGPSPRITRSILKTLELYCAKATFFPVGRMALKHPSVMKEIVASGHTIGGHTWSHPLNLRKLSKSRVIEQIEKGFAAVALTAEQPIAPFFRFPGLNDDSRALRYLQQRGVATFSVDVVSDDSFTSRVDVLTTTTLSRVSARNGGILLFHDIKSVTAKALPDILKGLAERGFSIVHLKSKFALTPLTRYEDRFRQILEKRAKPVVSVSLDGLQGMIRPSFAVRPPVFEPPVTILAPGRKKIELASTRNKRIGNLAKSIQLRSWSDFINNDTYDPAKTLLSPSGLSPSGTSKN